MRVTGLMVRAVPGMADEVARRLGRVGRVRVHGVHAGVFVVGVAEGFDDEQLGNLVHFVEHHLEGVQCVVTTATMEEVR